MANCKLKNIVQDASEVVRFSSQYGREQSHGYTAINLAGPARLYPRYGDFTEACVFRTYGPWWRLAPSCPEPIGREEKWFLAEDFIDLKFETPVIPTTIEICETYNPGTIVRIVALIVKDDMPSWEVLWSGSPTVAKDVARKFSPTLKKIEYHTSLLRLELNHSMCKYYTELDAVRLSGYKQDKPTIMNSLALKFKKINVDKGEATSSRKTRNPSLFSHSSRDEKEKAGLFQDLPDEVICRLLEQLHVCDLGIMSQTCRFFWYLCNDPVLYKELNLQPFWTKIDDAAIEGLTAKLHGIEKLNASWLGLHGAISSGVFQRMVESSSKHLTHLRLACCQFINSSLIHSISSCCQELEVLDLSSVEIADSCCMAALSMLKKLKSLNVYRVPISDAELTSIFMGCVGLEHVNIGSNILLQNGNQVVSTLAENCRQLKSLNLWRCKTISSEGILALANFCRNLLELDVGWCSNVNRDGDCLVALAKSCPHLKKVFLTAVRSVTSQDVNEFAANCHELEQFDILGTNSVSKESIACLLDSCRQLKMLDVSFCSQIDYISHKDFSYRYPNVNIKKSFCQ